MVAARFVVRACGPLCRVRRVACGVGVGAPQGLPEARRAQLEKAFMKAAQDPDYLRVVNDMAMLANVMDGKGLQAAMQQSYDQIGQLVKAIGLAQQQ